MRKITLLILLVQTAIFAQGQFPGENEGNLVFNASFEDQPTWGKENNDQFGWECRNCSRPDITKEIGPNGHKFSAPAAGGDYFGYTWAHDASIWQTMEAAGNTQYTVKFKFGWLHWTTAIHPIDSESAPLVTCIVFDVATNKQLKKFELNQAGYATKVVNNTLEFDKWNDVEFEFTTPEDVFDIKLRLYKTNGTAPYMLDNVEIFPTPAASINKFKKFDFKLSPNPATNVLNIQASKPISNVEFFNVLGQKNLSKSINALNSNVDISNLKKGIYLVNVTIDGQTQAYKVVKE